MIRIMLNDPRTVSTHKRPIPWWVLVWIYHITALAICISLQVVSLRQASNIWDPFLFISGRLTRLLIYPSTGYRMSLRHLVHRPGTRVFLAFENHRGHWFEFLNRQTTHREIRPLQGNPPPTYNCLSQFSIYQRLRKFWLRIENSVRARTEWPLSIRNASFWFMAPALSHSQL